MQTATLVELNKIAITEEATPEPGAGEVRIKVAAVGVCGSDIHYYAEGKIGSQVVSFPFVMGHEPAGIVDAVGEGTTLAVGTRVAVEPAMPCFQCEHCRAGRANVCPNVRFLGTPPTEGIFRQYRNMPEHCCVPLPDSVSLTEGALLEPLGVGLHAVKLARLEVGESVAIIGAGPIGLITLLAARAAGAGEVYMSDFVPERLAMAKQLGATDVFNANDGDTVAWINDLTRGRGVHIGFECAGNQRAVSDAILSTGISGRVLLTGIPENGDIVMPMHECRRREHCLQHVRRSNREADAALPLIADGRIDLKPLATHYFGLSDTQEAFELAKNYRDGVVRAIIQPNGAME